MSKEVNEHAEIIKNTVYHSYPYNAMKLNFNLPHDEDCGGCIINAEVEKIVDELNRLSKVDEIISQLEHERNARKLLSQERHQAFAKANVLEEGSVVDLVEKLVEERDNLSRLLILIRSDIMNIENRFRE